MQCLVKHIGIDDFKFKNINKITVKNGKIRLDRDGVALAIYSLDLFVEEVAELTIQEK